MDTRILVDTSAIRDALRFRESPGAVSRFGVQRVEDAVAFWALIARPSVRLSYNALLEHHIGKRFPVAWANVSRLLQKCPIPLSRADGVRKADGSTKCGGDFGGTLRPLLGTSHDVTLRIASALHDPTMKVYKQQREKEYDLEHLESALELGATYFISTDYHLLRRLRGLAHDLLVIPTILRAQKIAKRPSEVLSILEAC